MNGHVRIGPVQGLKTLKTTACMIGQALDIVFQTVTGKSKIIVNFLVKTAVGQYIYQHRGIWQIQ
jgi:hypothetical protein